MEKRDLQVGRLYWHTSGFVFRYHGAHPVTGEPVLHAPNHLNPAAHEGDVTHPASSIVRPVTANDEVEMRKLLFRAAAQGADTFGIRVALKELGILPKDLHDPKNITVDEALTKSMTDRGWEPLYEWQEP